MVKIREDFRVLIPALSADERQQLEANLRADGCRDPLSLWGDVLIDGHNRFEICERLGIPFSTVQIDLKTKDDARLWIIHNQLGRRNLQPFDRVNLALAAKPIIEAKAKAKMLAGVADPSQNSDEGAPIRTDDLVAKMAGTSRDTVRKVEHINAMALPYIVRAVADREISINLADQIASMPRREQEKAFRAVTNEQGIKETLRMAVLADVAKIPIAQLHTGDEESYTPPQYIESARRVLGGITLDPASNDMAQKTVKADVYYTAEDDGLTKEWSGKVWLNPPYTALVINKFLDKLVDSYQSGAVTEAIVLTNNNTDTSWFHKTAAVASGICFTSGRINFLKRDGSTSSPTNGQMFFYLGKHMTAFVLEFEKHGFVMEPA